MVEEGLGSDFPHLSLLDSLNIAYIIRAKPSDHKFMFKWFVMMMLIMRVFLIDQVQQLCRPTYQKARQHTGPFKVLLERIRNMIQLGVLTDWKTLFMSIANPEQRAPSTQDWVFHLK